jgi:hypothetical protein
MRLNRRRAIQGAAGGLLALFAGAHSFNLPASASASGVKLTNPASRVLLPGEAGLNDFGLDFALTGPPAVFFAAGDTPGWSDDVKSSIGQFVFGYAATLTQPSRPSADTGRSVQVCIHHGFPTTADADIAWSSLTTALASRSIEAENAKVQTLDIVEVIVVDGKSILATVAGGMVNAVVLASRAGGDLVTVAIADFTGKQPKAEEALSLAEAEGKKLQRSREIERKDLKSAFAAQWTPGFQLGSASGAPFFAWPTMQNGAPVPVAGESDGQLQLRTQTNAVVQHQSHIEGPFWESAPAFPTHSLFYSAQSNFFESSDEARSFHAETKDRLRASMPDATLTEIHIGSGEHRFGYQASTSFGSLTAVTLHRIVRDSDFPLSLSVHIVAVPFSADAEALNLDEVIARLDPVQREMRDGLELCLVLPDKAPLIVPVNPPQ